jgi:hypothetical protein
LQVIFDELNRLVTFEKFVKSSKNQVIVVTGDNGAGKVSLIKKKISSKIDAN